MVPCGNSTGASACVSVGEIRIIGEDGKTETKGPHGNHPSWDHDGAHFVYINEQHRSACQCPNQLAEAAIDGSAARNVGIGEDPAWSPDGAHIAYAGDAGGMTGGGSTGTGAYHQVYVMNRDGTGVKRLTGADAATGSSGVNDRSPAWSPDSQRIAFVRETTGPAGQGGSGSVIVMNADGSSQHQVTTTGGSTGNLSWSPDGNRIAYGCGLPHAYQGTENVCVVDVRTGAVVRLTNSSDDSLSPTWSPDGRSIAFLRLIGSQNELWVMGADGSNQRRIRAADPGGTIMDPAFAPR